MGWERLGRAALLLIHGSGLALGAVVSAMAVLSVAENLAQDFPELALHRIAVALALAAVTAGFAAILPARGFTSAAPFLFALSFAGVCLVVDMNTRVMAKGFAPSEPTSLDYAISIGEIVAACIVAYLAWDWTKRLSRFPLI